MAEERAVPGEKSWAHLGPPHVARYLFAATHAQGRRVLDAATGTGYGARLLRIQGAAQVVGVDIDAAEIERARQRFAMEGVEYQADDCQQLDKVPGTFDVVCSFETIEHLPDPEAFLRAVGRHLKPDGLLIISTPDRVATPPFVAGRPDNIYHLCEWYRDEFAAMLSRHFGQVDMLAQVESAAVKARTEAVEALQQGLTWANPLFITLWRKLPGVRNKTRPWKRLAGLAAPASGDYPIVPVAAVGLLGEPYCHMALCRAPRETA
jgi:SAM-dependent methyltransferase